MSNFSSEYSVRQLRAELVQSRQREVEINMRLDEMHALNMRQAQNFAACQQERDQLRADFLALRKVYDIGLDKRVQLTADLKTAREALEAMDKIWRNQEMSTLACAKAMLELAKQALAQITEGKAVADAPEPRERNALVGKEQGCKS